MSVVGSESQRFSLGGMGGARGGGKRIKLKTIETVVQDFLPSPHTQSGRG